MSITQFPAHTCSHRTTPGCLESIPHITWLKPLAYSSAIICFPATSYGRKKLFSVSSQCSEKNGLLAVAFFTQVWGAPAIHQKKLLVSLAAFPSLQMALCINKHPGLGFILPENTGFFSCVHSICLVFHWPSLTVLTNHNFDTMGFSPHVCGFGWHFSTLMSSKLVTAKPQLLQILNTYNTLLL